MQQLPVAAKQEPAPVQQAIVIPSSAAPGLHPDAHLQQLPELSAPGAQTASGGPPAAATHGHQSLGIGLVGFRNEASGPPMAVGDAKFATSSTRYVHGLVYTLLSVSKLDCSLCWASAYAFWRWHAALN